MLYSTIASKDTNEDPKTSSIFETLLMLPDELFWGVLRNACFDNSNLPDVAGQIESYDFWPHWDPTGTTNCKLVEPDLFIRFQAFDLIIEAKYGEFGGQYMQQWKNEIISYNNEYSDDEKSLYFIAIGGNADKETEAVELSKNVDVNKCTWQSLLIQVSRLREEYQGFSIISNLNSSTKRILDLVELAFNVHGVYNIRWFDELAVKTPIISSQSLLTLKTFFHE